MYEELGVLGYMVSIGLTLCVAALGYFYHYQLRTGGGNRLDVTKLFAHNLPDLPPIKLTLAQLLGFDGTRSDGRILVALKGKIYDVSNDLPEFGLDGTLSHVAGRDFTHYLNMIMSLQDSEINYVDRWEAILEKNYTRVGIVIDDLGNPLINTVEIMSGSSSQNAKEIEDGQEDVLEANKITETDSETKILNVLSNKTLNEVLTAETLPSDTVSQKSGIDLNSDSMINKEVSDH
ncbi:membrane-associated progesterone receptor component 1 [Drosophila rhopaloa]|uniref:Membrane-associated progesterone receptor component 1 n=1 Tax=Drosophila rhopaloa TaxID=1041015 RepID=A0A6P4FRK4_DRORH|nr:membrane-associated progesterone receptor component 1 [Drosophila rhopaloa]